MMMMMIPGWKMEDFIGAKLYCPCTFADCS